MDLFPRDALPCIFRGPVSEADLEIGETLTAERVTAAAIWAHREGQAHAAALAMQRSATDENAAAIALAFAPPKAEPEPTSSNQAWVAEMVAKGKAAAAATALSEEQAERVRASKAAAEARLAITVAAAAAAADTLAEETRLAAAADAAAVAAAATLAEETRLTAAAGAAAKLAEERRQAVIIAADETRLAAVAAVTAALAEEKRLSLAAIEAARLAATGSLDDARAGWMREQALKRATDGAFLENGVIGRAVAASEEEQLAAPMRLHWAEHLSDAEIATRVRDSLCANTADASDPDAEPTPGYELFELHQARLAKTAVRVARLTAIERKSMAEPTLRSDGSKPIDWRGAYDPRAGPRDGYELHQRAA